MSDGKNCSSCGADSSFQVYTKENVVCSRCGLILDVIVDQGPPRTFADDPASQASAVSRADTYNPADFHNRLGTHWRRRSSSSRGVHGLHGLRLSSAGQKDDHPFLRELEGEVCTVMGRLYKGDTPEAVLQDALQYCRQFYHCQYMQKQGKEFRLDQNMQARETTTAEDAVQRKHHFSNRRKIVATSCWLAQPLTSNGYRYFSALTVSDGLYQENDLLRFKSSFMGRAFRCNSF